MSGMYEGAIQDLIDALGRLPGIGPKSAQRIAFHILQSDAEIAAHMGEVLWQLNQRAEAQKIWREGLQKGGDTETLRETLRRLKVDL